MSYYIISAIVIIVGYLFGSICSAVIVSRVFKLPDPRSEGSKNPGATNVLRLSGKKYAAIVMVSDVLKGTIPVLIAKLMPVSELIITYTCLAAVLGHMFPLFFSFKGGKGVATAIGGLLGLQFILGAMVVGIWILVAQITRYSSLASLISMTAMPLLALWTTEDPTLFTPLFFITLFIYYKHYENITRLLDGEESKISFSRFVKNQQTEETGKTPSEETSKKIDTKSSSKTQKSTTKKTTKQTSNKSTAKSSTTKNQKTGSNKAKEDKK